MPITEQTVTLSNQQKRPPEAFFKKSSSKKISNIHKKTPVLKSLLSKVAVRKACNFFKKNTPTHMFSCKSCEISNITYFEEQLHTFFWSDFRMWLFRTFFLDSRFQNHPDLVILEKY